MNTSTKQAVRDALKLPAQAEGVDYEQNATEQILATTEGYADARELSTSCRMLRLRRCGHERIARSGYGRIETDLADIDVARGGLATLASQLAASCADPRRCRKFSRNSSRLRNLFEREKSQLVTVCAGKSSIREAWLRPDIDSRQRTHVSSAETAERRRSSLALRARRAGDVHRRQRPTHVTKASPFGWCVNRRCPDPSGFIT